MIAAALLPPDLLPPNATPLERATASVNAQMAALDAEQIKALWNPDICPAVALPWLAWALSVEPWDHDWPVWRQREVIKASIPVHRIKGTLASMRQALTVAGFGSATIIEQLHRLRLDGSNLCNGIYYLGDPDKWPHYRIQLDKPITNAQAAFVRSLLDEAARAVSKLDALDFTAAFFSCNGDAMCDGSFNLGVA